MRSCKKVSCAEIKLFHSFPVDTFAAVGSLCAMSSRPLKWLAVVALTFALGGHWAILQSVAWVTMFAGYSQAAPLKVALVETFDGKHPCPLCKFVAKGKKSEQKQDRQKRLTKLDFFLVSSRMIVYPPAPDAVSFALLVSADTRRGAPPTPPPRPLLGWQ